MLARVEKVQYRMLRMAAHIRDCLFAGRECKEV
jgi:hypothetical protein